MFLDPRYRVCLVCVCVAGGGGGVTVNCMLTLCVFLVWDLYFKFLSCKNEIAYQAQGERGAVSLPWFLGKDKFTVTVWLSSCREAAARI